MIDKKEVFIHIGYPKTATTTLQNHFFKNLNGFDLIGQPLTRENSDMQKFIHKITDSEALEYDEEKIKEELNHFLTDNKNIIISEESFSTGSSLSGRVDRVQIAKRLKSLFHNAKIILVLREQKSIVKSYYLQKKKINIK